MANPLIYIPTLGRITRQLTWRVIGPTGYGSRTALVTPPEEAQALQRANPGVQVLACPAQGISGTRQWILDQHPEGKLLMVDDDLRFAKRQLDNPNKFLTTADPLEIQVMLDRLFKMLDQAPLVGLVNRSGANQTQPPVVDGGRIHDLMAIDVDVARENRWRLAAVDLPVMEDFNFALQVLVSGYPISLLSTHSKDGAGGPNTAGGCSTYRTLEMQESAAKEMQRRWPDFVSLSTRPGWNGAMSAPRTDVRIAWKKARQAGSAWRYLCGDDAIPDPDWSGLAPEWQVI